MLYDVYADARTKVKEIKDLLEQELATLKGALNNGSLSRSHRETLAANLAPVEAAHQALSTADVHLNNLKFNDLPDADGHRVETNLPPVEEQPLDGDEQKQADLDEPSGDPVNTDVTKVPEGGKSD